MNKDTRNISHNYPDQEAQAVAYREAVKCFADRGGECKRKTKTKTVCAICEKIHQ